MNPFAFRTRIESHPEELLALAKIWAVSTGRLDAIKALDSLPGHPSRAEVDPFAPYVSNWLADETAPKNVNLFPSVIKQIYEMPNPVKLLSEIRMDAVKLSDSDLSVTLSYAGKTANFHFDSIDSNLTKGGLITLLAEMHNDAHNPINFDGTMKSVPPLTQEYLSTSPIKEAIRNYREAQPMQRHSQKTIHSKFATLKDAAKALNAPFDKSNDKAVINDVR